MIKKFQSFISTFATIDIFKLSYNFTSSHRIANPSSYTFASYFSAFFFSSNFLSVYFYCDCDSFLFKCDFISFLHYFEDVLEECVERRWRE